MKDKKEILKPEELAAVEKFQEFDARLNLGYGSKANWYEMVHTKAYSDELIANKLIQLRTKHNAAQEIEDEDGVINTSVEFEIENGYGKKVKFSTLDCLNVIRAARQIRKQFKIAADIEALKTELKQLEENITTPEMKIEKLREQLNLLEGNKEEK